MVKLLILLLLLVHVSVSNLSIGSEVLSTETQDIWGNRMKRATLLKKKGNPDECNTPTCERFTSQMLNSMEHGADPCEEFYDLVCGRRIRENGFTRSNFEVLEYYLNTKITYRSEKYLQDFKRFYDSCAKFSLDFNFLMNIDYIDAPLVTSDITDLFVEAILLQAMPFFDIGLIISETKEKFQFSLPVSGVSYLKTRITGWSVFEESAEECLENLHDSISSKTIDIDKLHEEYIGCKKQLIKQYAEDFEQVMKAIGKITEKNMFLTELLDLNQRFIESAVKARSDQNSGELFKSMEINELNSKYGLIDWKLFFEKLTTNKTFSGNEKILVSYPSHYDFVFRELRKVDKDKLVSMIKEFIHFQLYRNLASPKHVSNKEIYCMNLAHELMPDIVTTIIYEINPAKKIFLPTHLTQMMFGDLKLSFGKSINDSKLDDISKEKFVKKLERLNLGLITTGDMNTTRDNYKDLKVRDNFTENVVILLKNYRKRIYEIVDLKSSSATLLHYFVSPFNTKPVTFYTSNAIVMHPGVFNEVPIGLPEHIRLAKIGFSLAQNLAKHFDPIGRGILTDNIKTNNAYYNDLVKQSKEIFEKYYMKIPYPFHRSFLKFKPINGDDYINELIYDNAAFKLVTDYLHKMKKKSKNLPWISSGGISFNQSFFIAFAQEFCDDQAEVSFMKDLFETKTLPPQIKVRNVISNSPFFGETFQCSEGSSFWLDPSVIRPFPLSPPDDYDDEEQDEGD
ncbi:endothelin-converting enzyme homolog [Diorhabda carinulata]|uniref:endothelin-converting enzyme homolog n=1 Tax=Diorhabda carinulata TaxID=1163345 RepID=UPI0025A0F9F9|nr:endothelin-converting enzyme homolog [Diorhabda carinulata]